MGRQVGTFTTMRCTDCGKRKTFHENRKRFIRSGWSLSLGMGGRCPRCARKAAERRKAGVA